MVDEGEITPVELSTTEFGVKCFQISEKQYLNPVGLFELMAKDPDIQRAGVFIARLEESAEGREGDEDSIKLVRALLEEDPDDKGVGGKVFRPEVHSVRDMWAEKNALEIVGCAPSDRRKKQYRELKETFRQQILKYDFSDATPTELELALNSGGVNACLNSLFEMLRDRDRKLLYAANTCSTSFLQTTATAAMKDMKTNLESLPVGPLLGITLPSLYIGSEASTFNLHIEDHALESVNRHVAGKAKIWFFVPPRHHQSLYNLVGEMGVQSEDRDCSVFLQHRHYFIDPRTLLNEGIPVTTVIQKPGDIVYVLPHSHHWGFNLGINLNEAVNCGSRAWVLNGIISIGRCQCFRVGGNFLKVELEHLFRELLDDDTLMQHYREGRLQFFSNLLRRSMAALHPHTGRPFDEPLKPCHLLGPEFADLEIGKPWKAPLSPNYCERREFWGGCELIDIEDSDDEEEKMERDEKGMESWEEENNEDEEEQLEGKAIGLIACTVCTWSTKEKGVRGIEAAKKHVMKCHATIAPKMLTVLKKKYDVNHRSFKTSQKFKCSVCGETKRGTKAHELRHLQSCLTKSRNSKDAPQCAE